MSFVPKEIKKINDYVWDIPTSYKEGMLVPARIIASKHLLEQMDNAVFDQVTNVACMPGIKRYAYALPDAHSGYGLNIGGVAAFDSETGIISPSGVGYDINCGMRLITTNLTYDQVKPKLVKLVDTLFKFIPTGVGCKGFVKLNKNQFENVMNDGVKWCVENGYGEENDIKKTESYGKIPWADASAVSQKAASRGINQLGTLGSGNHYCEIQVVKKNNIYDEELAKKFGLFENQVVVMVHCGSRGLGHQICSDHVKVFETAMKKYGITVKDRELTCAPFQSQEGQAYFKGMACAANMAFANRQVIMHRIREAFRDVFEKKIKDMDMNLVYDVAHNIAKIEEHVVDGKKGKYIVHRKGSTRAFGPGHPELIPEYQQTGQPVILGGSMETGSHLLVGTQKAMEETFGSTAHGSGRTMSRTQAKREFQGTDLLKSMRDRGIYVRSVTMPGLAEEAGKAYKDVDEVVETLHNSGISKKVVKLIPVGNIKGLVKVGFLQLALLLLGGALILKLLL